MAENSGIQAFHHSWHTLLPHVYVHLYLAIDCDNSIKNVLGFKKQISSHARAMTLPDLLDLSWNCLCLFSCRVSITFGFVPTCTYFARFSVSQWRDFKKCLAGECRPQACAKWFLAFMFGYTWYCSEPIIVLGGLWLFRRNYIWQDSTTFIFNYENQNVV